MILKRIEAENILQYRKLRLADLPQCGQIAVAGPNEAGKTAIGETICLALFGRTFSLGPDELDKMIHWGECNGSVTLEFVGPGGVDYVAVREIDNTGKHEARLYVAGEIEPMAEGAAAVGDAISDLGGSTYQCFIDTFYLAQREMEVPHGKSATVKGLIGVDQLEATAAGLHSETKESAATIRDLETKKERINRQVAEMRFDRAELGRLESQRATMAEALRATEAEGESLCARATSVDQAASDFVEAAEAFADTTLGASHRQWQERRSTVEEALNAAAATCANLEVDAAAIQRKNETLAVFDRGLAGYERIHNLAGLYREQLAKLLDEDPLHRTGVNDDAPTGEHGERRFSDRRGAVLARINKVTQRSRTVLTLGLSFAALSLLGAAGWAVTRLAPESSLASWLFRALPAQGLGGQVLFIGCAVTGALLGAAVIALYVRSVNELKVYHGELEKVDAQIQVARVEIGIIDCMEETPLPEALDALRGVKNDLLTSALDSFMNGDGIVFVNPDVLAANADDARRGFTSTASALRRAQEILIQTAENLSTRAKGTRQRIREVEQGIADEKQRWEQVQALERSAADLQAKADELRNEAEVRELAMELIRGACGWIYTRFHSEIRRVVSKILPELTENRYDHLELDEDLRIRVFCKEKNGFVGFAEISNGTHRQLMLSVRLALAQARIASSSNEAQFVFLDEPFAFFDETRMAKAIAVLRRTSPQITQVWLVAQRFNDPSAFEMVVNCEANCDCLDVSYHGGSEDQTLRFEDAAVAQIG